MFWTRLDKRGRRAEERQRATIETKKDHGRQKETKRPNGAQWSERHEENRAQQCTAEHNRRKSMAATWTWTKSETTYTEKT